MSTLETLKKVGLASFVASLSFAGGLATALAPSSVHASATAAESVAPASPLAPPARVVEGLQSTNLATAADPLQVNERTVAPDGQGRYVVIVRFEDPSLAAYRGGTPGLAATSPRARGETRLNVNAPHSRAYLAYLEQRHSEHLTRIQSSIGRSPQVEHRFLNVLNAVSLRATLDEARKLQSLPFVKGVHLDEVREPTTDIGPGWIGAPAVWNGDTNSGLPNKGEGVVIGIIDSGFVHSHPSFAEVSPGDGYVHVNPLGAGNFLGLCPSNPGLCNNKLIGSYNFHPSTLVSEDTDGHGTHVASTAGGNPLEITYRGLPVSISGVAPRANLINYRVCFPGCPGSSSIAAVNQAINDGIVDVLNYSISGSDNPWNDPVDLAFLDAFAAGIYVSASAGNSGPGASTVAKTGPWNATVANSTHNRLFANSVDAAGLTDLAGVQGNGPALLSDLTAPLITAASLGNVEACSAFAAGSMTGRIALIRRGSCTFAIKINNAVAAGAVGVIMYNNQGGPPSSMGGIDGTTVPSLMIDNASGQAVEAAADGASTATLYSATSLRTQANWGDVMANTSSRGPSQFDLVKPDFAAPGTNILAAYYDPSASPVYAELGGTSMASPHGAGAAALLIKENPGWSPAEVKSALALTANPVMFKENGLTPSDPFDRGSGRIDLNGAARIPLVMDETLANFVAANPGSGGDPRTLNLPSLMNRSCIGSCSFTRTVSSTLSSSWSYTVEVSAPAGVTVTVSPNVFTLAAGADQVLTIDVVVDDNTADLGNWNFGEIRLVPATELGSVLEDFTAETFPPNGWRQFKLEGAGTTQWIRDTAQSNSAPASARRLFGNSGDGNQDDWLVTRSMAIVPGSVLSYFDRGQWMADYGYSGIWISTGSCDPADGAFVELLETADIPGNAWRAVPVEVDLGAYAGQNACLAFRYSGTFAHTWWIDDVGIAPVAISYPILRLPLAVVPESTVPEIEVSPDSISATGVIGAGPVQRSLRIDNLGAVDLNWQIDEAATGSAALWEQPVNGSSGIVSDFFIGSGAGAYSASDFVLSRDTTLASIFTPGFDNTNSLSAQPSITWAIYADAAGEPAGHPEDGTAGASALWTFSAAPTDPGVSIAGNNISLDLIAAAESLQLGPGTYWLTVYPSYNVTGAGGARWNWYQAAQVGGQTKLISPGIFSVTSWTDLGALGVTFSDTAFTLSEALPCAIEPWLSVTPVSGLIGPAAFENIEVTLDPDALTEGTYTANICIASDDSNNPLVVVPVEFTVELAPEIALSETALAGTAQVGAQAQASFDIQNVGAADLNWSIDTAGPFTLAPMSIAPLQLHDNGPFITSFGDGPGGSDASLLQNVSLGLTTLGGGVQFVDPGPHNRIADNFTVSSADGWDVRSVRFFGYQTGSTTTSSFTGVNLRIWDGEPGVEGSNVVFGDTSTNRIAGTGWTGAYRYAESAVGNTTRPIMYVDAEVNTILPPGEYWIDWQLAGSIASGPWQPAISIIGQAVTGNALQMLAAGWQPFVDGGAGNPAQGAPFVLSGFDDWCYAPSAVAWLGVSPDSGSTVPGDSETVTVTMDAAGLSPGSYQAKVCVFSNDPANPIVGLPVSFEVTQIPQTIDFAALDDRLIGDSPFTVSATASSGLAVSFDSLTGSVCDVSGNEVSLLAVGTCSIQATQGGDATYGAAAPVVQSFEVIEAEVLVSPGSLPRAAIDQPYAASFSASGTGTTAPFTFAVTDGALPDGLVLATDGELSGTPTVDGVFEFTVTATDSSSADVGGPFSGSRAYTLIVDEEFIFFDGFEEIGPLLKLLFERAGVHKVELPLAGSLAALPAGSSAVIGEVLLKGERVAQIEAQCLDQGCALRLRATDAAKAGSDSRWLSIQSEPFGLVVELSESALLKASSQD